jgi:hypothetical protein
VDQDDRLSDAVILKVDIDISRISPDGKKRHPNLLLRFASSNDSLQKTGSANQNIPAIAIS